MRLLFISDHADPLAEPDSEFFGGQNTYVRALAEGLAAAGDEVTVATRRNDAALPDRQQISEGAQVVRITAGPPGPMPRDRFGEVLDEFTDGIELLHQEGDAYDLIHSHYWYAAATALTLRKRHGAVVVHTHHSIGAVRHAALPGPSVTATDDYFARRHRVESEIGQQASALVVSCPAEAQDAHRLCGTPVQRMRLVPPGVDPSVLRPTPREQARAALSIPARVPVVLFLGRLEERKGWREAIEAFAHVREGLPSARLLIVGGGPDTHTSRQLTEVARRHSVLDALDVRGAVPHEATALYYSAADVTVVPSHYEPFGLVAIESMACGTPVVACRVGGLAWTVANQRVGTLVAVRDAASLGRATLDILQTGRAQYQQACMDTVADRFTIRHWVAGIQAAYRSVLRPEKASPASARDGSPS